MLIIRLAAKLPRRWCPLSSNVRLLEVQSAQVPVLVTRASTALACCGGAVHHLLGHWGHRQQSRRAVRAGAAKSSNESQSMVRAPRASAAPGEQFVVVAAWAATGFGPGSCALEPVEAPALNPRGSGSWQRRGSRVKRWSFGLASGTV